MKTIIANIVRGGGKTTGFLLAALFAFAFAGAEPAQADEIVDLGGGEPISASASDFSAYKDKIIQHGTINLSESPEKVSVGKYTIGSGATVNFAAGPGFNGNWDWNIVDGGSLNQTKTSEGRMLLPFYYGNCKFTMDNGTFTSQDPGGNSNYAETLNFGVIWANDSKVKDQDISVKVVVRNGSTISLPNGSLRVAGGRKSSNVKVNTLKVDFAITNSTITMAKELQLGSAQSTSTWITDSASSYVNAIFGPGSDITAKQIYAQANPMPSVTFDGATLRWVQGGNSFIGHTSSIGDIYTIDAGGLTVDIPSGKSLSCDQNASSLKGEGGITKRLELSFLFVIN